LKLVWLQNLITIILLILLLPIKLLENFKYFITSYNNFSFNVYMYKNYIFWGSAKIGKIMYPLECNFFKCAPDCKLFLSSCKTQIVIWGFFLHYPWFINVYVYTIYIYVFYA